MEDIVERVEPNRPHDLLSSSHNSHFPFLDSKVIYFFDCVRTGEKIFPAAPDELETLRIFEDLLLALDAAVVIQITHRSDARSPAHLRFLEHPAHHIFAKIDGELRRHHKLNGHLNHVIGWEVSLLRRDDCFKDSLLEHPLDAATIDGVPCQPIQSPTKNGISFTTLDTQEHFVELLPSC